MAAPAADDQIPLAVEHIEGASVPTRGCEGEARCQCDLDHWRLTLPAPQPHHSLTWEAVGVVHRLKTHAHTGMTAGSQEKLTAVVMRTVRRLTAATDRLVELV